VKRSTSSIADWRSRTRLFRNLVVTCAFATVVWPSAADAQGDTSAPKRPVHTFSIVTRDPATGELGVAVQSHWFNIGPLVPWIEAGVGAIATQSFVDPSYGKLGLDLMRAGKSAPDTLKALVAGDPASDVRQVPERKTSRPPAITSA
jgi:Family of unknown function (DUF1028)